ncbi:hypothetical protein ACSFA8_26665 [Variovorax sp. RT4R15]|uniref:hypothetical protein n=1 Tax=Variovorax sp. RT4R15 TaxID=3443737 RepID=UPI003F450E4D
MSIDFILIKAKNQPARLDDIEADPDFDLNDSRTVALALFKRIKWEADGVGFATLRDVSFELHPHAGSLSVWCRGEGDINGAMAAIAETARDMGMVTVDVQTGELFDGAGPDPEYLRWYRGVLADHGK